jgi:hypothetical protein
MEAIVDEVLLGKSATVPAQISQQNDSYDPFLNCGLPEKYIERGREKYEKYKSYFIDNDNNSHPGWEPYYKESGVTSYKMMDTDNVPCVKGVGIINKPLYTLLKFWTNYQNIKILNPNVLTVKKLAVYSNKCLVRQIVLKQVITHTYM